jgi:hypothetical protein
MPDVEAMAAGQNPRSGARQDAITVLQEVEPPFIPAGAHAMTVPVRFTVTMLCEPGKPMLTLVHEEELARRKNRRAARSN